MQTPKLKHVEPLKNKKNKFTWTKNGIFTQRVYDMIGLGLNTEIAKKTLNQ